MDPSGNVTVIGQGGLRGTIDTRNQPADKENQVLVLMDNGQQVLVPTELLTWQEDGSYYLPMSLEQLDVDPALTGSTSVVIPVVAEELAITKRQVKTGGVRLTKRVHTREEVVDEPGYQERIEVKRIPVNQVIDHPAQIRYEGETMIVPLMEEVFVVEKRLVLKEEVRITKYREEFHKPQKVILRTEEAHIERFGEETEHG